MAYTIAELIYGVPLMEEIDLPFPKENHLCFPHQHRKDLDGYPYQRRSEVLTDILDDRSNYKIGFLTYYTGNSSIKPGAFGIHLTQFEVDDLFSEFEAYLQISDETRKEFNALFQALPQHLQQEVSAYGEPRLFFLWTTS